MNTLIIINKFYFYFESYCFDAVEFGSNNA